MHNARLGESNACDNDINFITARSAKPGCNLRDCHFLKRTHKSPQQGIRARGVMLARSAENFSFNVT